MLFRDFSYAARVLKKSPVFTAAITIALGIGAGTAIVALHCRALNARPILPGRLARHFYRRASVRDFTGRTDPATRAWPVRTPNF
jgi:hypothetical protein